MVREDILSRVTAKVEEYYSGDNTKFKGVEVINFEVMDDNSLRIHVKVSFYGASTILHGRINDARDFGVFLTQDELDFLDDTVSQAPAQVTPPTRVAQYTAQLVSQLRHVVGDDRELSCLTRALLSNPNLIDLMHSDRFYSEAGVDSIVAYVERALGDLACDPHSGAAVLWVTSLLSNPGLMSIIQHQRRLDEIEERYGNC